MLVAYKWKKVLHADVKGRKKRDTEQGVMRWWLVLGWNQSGKVKGVAWLWEKKHFKSRCCKLWAVGQWATLTWSSLAVKQQHCSLHGQGQAEATVTLHFHLSVPSFDYLERNFVKISTECEHHKFCLHNLMRVSGTL